MLRCKWYELHSWVKIREKITSRFLGENVEETRLTEFKICNKCLAVKEYYFDSQGGSWVYLDEQRRAIIVSKLDSDFIICNNKKPLAPKDD